MAMTRSALIVSLASQFQPLWAEDVLRLPALGRGATSSSRDAVLSHGKPGGVYHGLIHSQWQQLRRSMPSLELSSTLQLRGGSADGVRGTLDSLRTPLAFLGWCDAHRVITTTLPALLPGEGGGVGGLRAREL